jgi:hypothetical protein
MKLGFFSLFCRLLNENKWSSFSTPALATLGILNYTHLYQTFWVGLAKVAYNNFLTVSSSLSLGEFWFRQNRNVHFYQPFCYAQIG